MAVSVLEEFKIPYGVVINRSNQYDYLITDYLKKKNIELIGKIPYSKKAAELYSNGELLIKDNELKKHFENIAEFIKKKVDINENISH
jgi:MinD superfamily P-loop ATPase